jgi:hypothetical protein
MARLFLHKSALAIATTLGLSAGIALAQSAYAPPPRPVAPASPAMPPTQPQTTVDPTSTDAPACDGQAAPRTHLLRDAFENRSRPLHDALANHQPVGCWAHHNMFGCGSFHSEMTFIFGSCRAFYGQQCLKEPPPDELAPMREGTADAAPLPRSRPPFSFCPWCR